jgi:hypothetical protein
VLQGITNAKEFIVLAPLKKVYHETQSHPPLELRTAKRPSQQNQKNQSVQKSHCRQLHQSILHHAFHSIRSPSLNTLNITLPTLPTTHLSVLRLDEVSHSHRLALVVVCAVRVVVDVVAVVAVAVAVVLGADVLHLVDGAALGAALDGAVARGGEPDDNVRVGGVAGAALVLLVAEGLDDDGVVQRSCG